MDPITHLASGVIGAQAFRNHFPKAPLFIPFCVLAAWIPDIDILFNRGNPEWNLLYHRAISTSFFGGILMALALAGLYKLASRKIPFWKTTLLAYGLICVHIWLDLITSYGTQLLAPFSNHRFSLDATFIIDPLLTITLLLFITASIFRKAKQGIIGLCGLAFIFGYPLASMAVGNTLESLIRHQYERQGIALEEFHFTPDAFTPFYWKVVSREGDEYSLTLANTFAPGKEYPVVKGKLANRELLKELGHTESMFTTWQWFARYPVQETTRDGNGTVVAFRDLRFDSVHPIMTALFKERQKPFVLEAYLNSQDQLVKWKFNHAAKRFVQQAVQ